MTSRTEDGRIAGTLEEYPAKLYNWRDNGNGSFTLRKNGVNYEIRLKLTPEAAYSHIWLFIVGGRERYMKHKSFKCALTAYFEFIRTGSDEGCNALTLPLRGRGSIG